MKRHDHVRRRHALRALPPSRSPTRTRRAKYCSSAERTHFSLRPCLCLHGFIESAPVACTPTILAVPAAFVPRPHPATAVGLILRAPAPQRIVIDLGIRPREPLAYSAAVLLPTVFLLARPTPAPASAAAVAVVQCKTKPVTSSPASTKPTSKTIRMKPTILIQWRLEAQGDAGEKLENVEVDLEVLHGRQNCEDDYHAGSDLMVAAFRHSKEGVVSS
ncbi:hypothetical protein PsYK624_137300 [Phanerochaete sordida]|uniref:Uncharacterized protein n=1 Tax=Phanerochaete sordida TaxID=48140 RepID=A0A9P3LKA5_9APHY|nr:hypothetical protein PsYK624_137300 [Phanerochaete sordida]